MVAIRITRRIDKKPHKISSINLKREKAGAVWNAQCYSEKYEGANRKSIADVFEINIWNGYLNGGIKVEQKPMR